MEKLLKAFLLLILLFCLNCKTTQYSTTKPYYDDCFVKGGRIDSIFPIVPDYVIDGISEIKKIESEYEIVYYYNFINGEPGDGISVCFINQEIFDLNQIKYDWISNKGPEWKIVPEPKTVSKKEQKFILSVLNELNEFPWGVEITCFDHMYEAYGMFYIKRNGEFQYYAKLQDCEFTEMPSLGLTNQIIQMLDIFQAKKNDK